MAESIHLIALIFHYQTGEGRLDPESTLVCVQGSRAHLKLAVPTPRVEDQTATLGQSATLQEPPDAAVAHAHRKGSQGEGPLTEVAPHTYEICAKELKDLFDRGERAIAGMWASGWLSTLGGKPWHVEAPIADGVLEVNGFRLTNPQWAGGIGLEAGDVILAFDDRAVNSFSDHYEAYQRLHRPVQCPRFEVTLERDGVPLTKTYLIR